MLRTSEQLMGGGGGWKSHHCPFVSRSHWRRIGAGEGAAHDPFGIKIPVLERVPPSTPINPPVSSLLTPLLRHSVTRAPVDTELRRLIVTLVPAGIMEKGSRRPRSMQCRVTRNETRTRPRPPSPIIASKDHHLARTLHTAACIIPSIGPLSCRHSVLLPHANYAR